MGYEWPGNIRELENMIERAVALETEPVIRLASLPHAVRKGASPFSSVIPDEIPPEGIHLENLVDELEKDLLVKALEKTGWVKKHAAKLLHLSFRSFRYRLDKFAIDEKRDLDER
jgi:two-component system response regulator PilR (NtrC family)